MTISRTATPLHGIVDRPSSTPLVPLFGLDPRIDLDASFYQGILDRINDGVCLADRENRIRLWNHAAEKITGYRRLEVLGLGCGKHPLCHIDVAGRSLCMAGCPLQAAIETGATVDAEVYLQHKQGHRVPVHVQTIPLRDRQDRLVGVAEIFASAVEARRQDELIIELSNLAMIDDLTRLPNRRHFDMQLDRRLAELNRFGWPFGALMIDLDNFKQINDRHGHQRGDDVLHLVARTLSANSRSLDTVARWGGEEFAAIIANAREEELSAVAEKLRAMVEASGLHGPLNEPLRVTVSIGGALARPNETASELMKRADDMLYAAKKAGRNRVCM